LVCFGGRVSVNFKDLRRGFLDIFPMTLAYAPIAALWGTVAASKGLSPLEAILMSAGVYSGAGQFVAMDLWQKSMPLALFIFAIGTVALRHVLMSASVSRHIAGFPRGIASILLFWLTDEAWAMVERRALTQPITKSYYVGVALPLWPTWIAFTGIGATLGSALGDTTRIGLDFAFAAMFIAVLAGFWKGPKTATVLIASSLFAVLAKIYLPGAWYILAGGISGIIVAVVTYREGDLE
jgi:predicted branched-subunit amino acid permease